LRAGHPQVTFRAVPAVGEAPDVLAAMAAYCADAAG
jgi:sirohydrochlorin cobaltochelatase